MIRFVAAHLGSRKRIQSCLCGEEMPCDQACQSAARHQPPRDGFELASQGSGDLAVSSRNRACNVDVFVGSVLRKDNCDKQRFMVPSTKL